jgi:hypothetical protein
MKEQKTRGPGWLDERCKDCDAVISQTKAAEMLEMPDSDLSKERKRGTIGMPYAVHYNRKGLPTRIYFSRAAVEERKKKMGPNGCRRKAGEDAGAVDREEIAELRAAVESLTAVIAELRKDDQAAAETGYEAFMPMRADKGAGS